jgi:hypothetical protein
VHGELTRLGHHISEATVRRIVGTRRCRPAPRCRHGLARGQGKRCSGGGSDLHKASYTAVVISTAEESLGEVRVCACVAPGRAAVGLGRGLAAADLGGSRASARWATCWPSICWPPGSGS